MKTIYFDNKGTPYSDYEIEEAFSSLKENNIIHICNEPLLMRFRLGYAKVEIEKFKVILKDLNENIIEEEINDYFELYEIVNSKILSLSGKYASIMVKNKSECYLSKSAKIIVFSNSAKPVSDFDIESFYTENKHLDYIEINNEKLLDRFRVGVSQKEIPPINLIVFNEENKINTELSDSNGGFSYIWKEPILQTNVFIHADIFKCLAEKHSKNKITKQ